MPRPKNSSPKSYELIFNALIDGPRCYSEIIEETNLHRDTVASRLTFLVEERLIQKHKDGRKMMFDIIRNRELDLNWVYRWTFLMVTKNIKFSGFMQKFTKLLEVTNFEKSSENARKVLDNALRKKYDEKINISESQEFLKKAHEKNVPIYLHQILENLESPFCLECLDNYGVLYRSKCIIEGYKYNCLNCGVEIYRI